MSTKTPAQAAEEAYPPLCSPDAIIGITIDQIARLAFVRGAEWQASHQRGEPVEWRDPSERVPPSDTPAGHILLGYSNRKEVDEDYSLRQLAFCPDPPEQIWTDWYGQVPTPDRWTIIPVPEKDVARWYMPKREAQPPRISTEQIMAVVERWRWKPGTTSLTAMEDLRDRLSKLLPQ